MVTTGRGGVPAADGDGGIQEDILLRRRTEAANARARRAATRARQAEARAAVAEARLAAMLSSKAWRVTYPLRWLSAAVSRPIPAGQPAADPGAQAGAQPGVPAACPAPMALLVDDNWPRPDRDAGSIEIVNLAHALRQYGYTVHFAVDASRSGVADVAAQADLAAAGVVCLPHPDATAVDAFLEGEGGRYRVIVLNRVYCGGRLFERVRTWCPEARVIFNTIDLHHVRIAREAAISCDAPLAAVAEATRAREEMLAAEADATFVVSNTEALSLHDAQPGANVFVLPLARPIHPTRAPFAARAGIGFIGGFSHAPNLDAVRFFLREVWPLVERGWPECRFSIVGADLPAGVLDGLGDRVEYLGPVADVGPWFESLRLTVAPLRFGAGVKGKVVSSLAVGVPCVATAVAAEGMGLRHETDALLADDPEEMAGQIMRLRDDAALWTRLRDGGMAHVARQFSPEAWRHTLRQALWTIDALPGGSEEAP